MLLNAIQQHEYSVNGESGTRERGDEIHHRVGHRNLIPIEWHIGIFHGLARASTVLPEFDRAALGPSKRTVLANILFRDIDDLADAFRRGIGRVNDRRDKMGFMFD